MRQQAKEQGIKGYSAISKDDLILALQCKPVSKRIRKNQVKIDFPACNECEVKALVTHLSFKAKTIHAKVIYVSDMEIDAETGAVLD